MIIYSLVGKSGSGKSYQAIGVCMQHEIDCIIDDGLLIERGRIRAGRSAKRQETKIGAIKTALFTDPAMQAEVARAIKKSKPQSLLIVATSDRMADRIAQRLGLPEISTRLYIEDLTTEEERQVARERRYEKGEHIIPAPTFQIRKYFSGYFIHPLKSIRDFTDDLWDGMNPFTERDGREPFAERSVVRPTYSYLGKYTISERALRDIVTISGEAVAGVDSVPHIFVRDRNEGAIMEVGLIVEFGACLPKVAEAFQEAVQSRLEGMTSVNVLAVDVKIEGLMWPVKKEKIFA